MKWVTLANNDCLNMDHVERVQFGTDEENNGSRYVELFFSSGLYKAYTDVLVIEEIEAWMLDNSQVLS